MSKTTDRHTSRLPCFRQKEAAKIDEELFSIYGFKVEQLMELAGLACAKAVHAQYSKGTSVISKQERC